MGCGASSTAQSPATAEPIVGASVGATVVATPAVKANADATRVASFRADESPAQSSASASPPETKPEPATQQPQKLNQAGKPITLADDSPPSSPGMSPQRDEVSIVPAAAEVKKTRPSDTRRPQARSDQAANVTTPVKADAAKGRSDLPVSPSSLPLSDEEEEEEDAETAALRAHILSQTDDLIVQPQASSKPRNGPGASSDASRSPDAGAAREKRRDVEETKTLEDATDPRRVMQPPPPYQDKYGGASSANANVWSSDTDRLVVPAASASGSSTPTWSYAAASAATAQAAYTVFQGGAPSSATGTGSGKRFTSWGSTSRGGPKPHTPQTPIPPVPTTPLALPSWQQGFDAEKFRRAQVDLAPPKKESFVHTTAAAEDDADSRRPHHLHHQYQTSSQSTARISDVHLSTPAYGRDAKNTFSREEEAMLDDLLADNDL